MKTLLSGLNAKNITRKLILISLILATLHMLLLFLTYYAGYTEPLGIIEKFNMDIELSIPTWYATMLLFLASALAFIIFRLQRLTKSGSEKKWLVLSIFLLYMSADEGSEIHELAVAPIRYLLNIESGIFYFAWVIPFGILALGALFYFFNFWLRLEPDVKKYLLISVVLFISGAVGIELIGAYYVSTYTENRYVYSSIIAIEESLEIVGISILIYALLLQIQLVTRKIAN